MSDYTNPNTEFVDYVNIDGDIVTPNSLRSRFDLLRKKIFDMPIKQVPIKKESEYTLHPERLAADEIFDLNHQPYNLDSPTSDNRVKNPFQYYTYLLSGTNNNLVIVLNHKRKILRMSNEINVIYSQLYADCLKVYGNGAQGMGSNDKTRNAWMHNHFPALMETKQLIEGFLEEIEIEADKLEQRQVIISRCLTGIENDTRMRGEYAWSNPTDKANR